MRLPGVRSVFIALSTVFAVMLGIPATTALAEDDSARGSSEPETVECVFQCSREELQEFITDAGSDPTKIVLGLLDTDIDETLVIPAGADITIVNAPTTDPNYVNDTRLLRENGFAGTLIEVEEGAKLTLDKNESGIGTLSVGARGEWVKANSPAIEVKGELIMNHGRVEGARGLSKKKEAAITVTGSNAKFVLNEGKVTDNQRLLGSPSTTQEGAANVALSDGATMVMNGGEISKGRAMTDEGAYGETGGIGLFGGSHLTINGGTITGNHGWAGNIGIYSWLSGANTEGYETKRSIVEINGGEISKGYAQFGGGGINIFGNGAVTMNAGQISYNKAAYGGGVNAMDLYVKAGDNPFEEVPAEGKGNGFTTEEWTEISPASFTMRGGTISNNWSANTGGGVNTVSNGVWLLGGEISNNTADSLGGGLYVATESYSAHLQNALVTRNGFSDATKYDRGKGGGIWLCPTGSLTMHVTDGGAIFDNTAPRNSDEISNYYGDDIAHDNYGQSNPAKLILDKNMLGGGESAYYKDGGVNKTRFDDENRGKEQIFQNLADDSPKTETDDNADYRSTLSNEGLKNVASDEAKLRARAWSSLIITGNKAPRGSGIGSNGNVTFGTPESTEISVRKEWTYTTGQELSEDLKVPVTVQLEANFADEAETFPVAKPVVLDGDNNWSYTFRDLPTENRGRRIIYSVKELDSDILKNGFSSSVAVDPDKEKTFIVKNELDFISIPVEKFWEGGEVTDRPKSVTVRLLQNGERTDQTITLNEANGWKGQFTNLQPYKTWDGETGQFEANVYSVVEDNTGSFESLVSGDQTGGFKITNRFIPTEPTTQPTTQPTTEPGGTEPSTTVTSPVPPTSTEPSLPGRPQLPKTGTDLLILTPIAIALLIAGGGILIARRQAK